MKPTYSDAGKLAWYPDIACPVCGGDVNSWDKRCSRALGYRQIVCEGCISEEYQVTVENLRYVMENHFGLVPCPGIIEADQCPRHSVQLQRGSCGAALQKTGDLDSPAAGRNSVNAAAGCRDALKTGQHDFLHHPGLGGAELPVEQRQRSDWNDNEELNQLLFRNRARSFQTVENQCFAVSHAARRSPARLLPGISVQPLSMPLPAYRPQQALPSALFQSAS